MQANNNIFNEIARAIGSNTESAIGGAIDGIGLDLGTITSTGLKLDHFKHEIRDYLVLDYLKLEDSYYTENSSCSVGASHRHEFKTPVLLKRLKVGQRVLVAQVFGDNVIVGRLSSYEQSISDK